MFMEKIEAPRVTCDLFGVQSGFYGSGNGGHITGDKPRAATETEARAYADFLRRKCGLPDLGKPAMHTATIGGGRGQRGHFHYVGATFGQVLSGGGWEGEGRDREYVPAQYEPGAFSVLFPGANLMRAGVTMETLDDAGNVTSSQTMPVEPKKGGVVWSKDDVRKACGPVAKVKAARAPTVAKRRAAPTVDKRRRAVLLALKLRAELRRARWALNQHNGMGALLKDELEASYAVQQELRAELASARQMPQNRAAPVSAPDAPATAPDAILSDLAAAEALMRGDGYVAPRPLSMREAFTALYRIARRDKLAGLDLMNAACDLTGEPREMFQAPRSARLFNAVTHALAAPEPMRRKLALSVLNGWGHCNPYRAPMMDSPRFAAWRRTHARAIALRDRLKEAGRLEYDAGNWVCAVLPLPVAPESAPTVDEADTLREGLRIVLHRGDYEGLNATVYSKGVGYGWAALTDCGRHVSIASYGTPDRGWSLCPTVDEAGPTPTAIQASKRTPAHERAIRRAWDARKAHRWERAARQRLGNVCDQMRDQVDALEYQSQQDRNAKVAADDAIVTYRQKQAEAEDRAKLAEQIAEDHMRMREDLQRLLAATEARLAAAEAENAQLWGEIEALTAPQPALAA